MTFRTHYLMIALLAGFGLALGACGGGGSDAPVTDMMPEPEPTGPTADEAKMAVTDAIAALATARDAVGPASDALVAATLAVDAARADLAGAAPGADQDAAIAALMAAQANHVSAQSALTAAEGAVTSATMALESARATLEEVAPDSLALLDAQQALADAQAAAMAAAEKAKADAEKAAADAKAELEKAIAERDALQDKLDEMQAADMQEKMEGIFAAIKATVENEADPDSTTTPPARLRARDGDPAADAAYATKPAVAVSNSFVGNDKGPDTTVAFTKHYETRLTAGAATGDILNIGQGATGGPGANTAEAGAASDDDEFPKNGGTGEYTEEATDSITIRGTLMKASGAFKCTGATCTITEDGGKYTFSEAWTFDPDAGTTVTLEDMDYNRWGWWYFLRKDGTYRVETFASAAMATDDITGGDTASGGPGTDHGTVTYEGTAAGKYAIDNRPTGTILEAGHFSASAELKADLGATPTVSGTIDEFMVDGEAKEDWSVALGTTSITWGDANATPAVRDFDTAGDTAQTAPLVNGGVANVWTIGGVKGAADGDWSGDFHHDGDAREDGTPATVIGQFTASHGTTAYMAGAFGAENMAADTPADE